MSFVNELTDISKINQRFMYRRNSRETSIEAARSVHPSLSAIALDVLRYAYDQGYAGFTDIQLAIDLECETSTYRSRRADLTRLGLIVDNGNRVKHLARNNRNHIVWIHKDFKQCRFGK